MRGILMLVLFLLSACAPSEIAIQTALAGTQASYTATPSATKTPQPTPSPDPLDYLAPYGQLLEQWGLDFENIRQANQNFIADPGTLPQLQQTLKNIELTSQKLADLVPPSHELQTYQDKAEALRIKTETFVNLYLLGLAGAPDSTQLAISELENAVAIYTDIIETLSASPYLTP